MKIFLHMIDVLKYNFLVIQDTIEECQNIFGEKHFHVGISEEPEISKKNWKKVKR